MNSFSLGYNKDDEENANRAHMEKNIGKEPELLNWLNLAQ
jgi:hypothetical protein